MEVPRLAHYKASDLCTNSLPFCTRVAFNRVLLRSLWDGRNNWTAIATLYLRGSAAIWWRGTVETAKVAGKERTIRRMGRLEERRRQAFQRDRRCPNGDRLARLVQSRSVAEHTASTRDVGFRLRPRKACSFAAASQRSASFSFAGSPEPEIERCEERRSANGTEKQKVHALTTRDARFTREACLQAARYVLSTARHGLGLDRGTFRFEAQDDDHPALARAGRVQFARHVYTVSVLQKRPRRWRPATCLQLAATATARSPQPTTPTSIQYLSGDTEKGLRAWNICWT